ncbi:ATP-dependent RNA helicase ddx1 [Clonorchis sinensis]|uniref:ATP-dependent RNA helicase ddx1 n=1 Tax=Clonorchis sinensis TaxID=79923 RepID=A0A8T1MT75_CLOSI|nr:ATP-dependent RNA helicase ddx1 [Clonorchis sinensis]
MVSWKFADANGFSSIDDNAPVTERHGTHFCFSAHLSHLLCVSVCSAYLETRTPVRLYAIELPKPSIQVWYHSNCPTRGRGCYNTRLVEHGGCCIWYNEPNLLGDIEEHLGITIDAVDSNLLVQADAFDGKVVYGQKLKQLAPKYKTHVDVLASAVKELNQLEKKTQQSYLRLKYAGEITA